jgi:hypothetical protein
VPFTLADEAVWLEIRPCKFDVLPVSKPTTDVKFAVD